jgi:hypothetical protein
MAQLGWRKFQSRIETYFAAVHESAYGLAQSGHGDSVRRCPLSGVKRTSAGCCEIGHSGEHNRRSIGNGSLAILVDAQKPKADDKAYNAALKSLPDKPYDPWHGVR